MQYNVGFFQVVGSTPNLTLTVDSATAGRYNCKAAVHGFPEIEADAVVYLKGIMYFLSIYICFESLLDDIAYLLSHLLFTHMCMKVQNTGCFYDSFFC